MYELNAEDWLMFDYDEEGEVFLEFRFRIASLNDAQVYEITKEIEDTGGKLAYKGTELVALDYGIRQSYDGRKNYYYILSSPTSSQAGA